MKRVMGPLASGVVCLAGILVAGSAWAQSPGFPSSAVSTRFQRAISWHDNLESGWRESQRSGRPMVIFITAARCHYCDAMKQATWKDQGVEKRVNDGFVAVQLSPERNPQELSRITVEMYPMTIVAVPQGKVIGHRKGFQPPERMHELLNRAALQR